MKQKTRRKQAKRNACFSNYVKFNKKHLKNKQYSKFTIEQLKTLLKIKHLLRHKNQAYITNHIYEKPRFK